MLAGSDRSEFPAAGLSSFNITAEFRQAKYFSYFSRADVLFPFFALPEIPCFYIELPQVLGQRFKPAHDDVNHRRIISRRRLNVPVGNPGGCPASNAVVSVPSVLMNDKVDRARFIFERDERNSLRRSWPLPQKHEPGDNHRRVILQFGEPLRRYDP